VVVPPIRAVIFDMGGTLEDLYYDEASRTEATHGLHKLLIERDLDPCLPLPDLQAAVLTGMRAYQEWREQSERELSSARVWTEYIFPNQGLPKGRLMANAEDLSSFYETHFYVRSLRPEAPALLDALRERGFSLAIISNIIGRRVVQECLKWYGIEHYFNPVVTSAGFGWRKPNARIFLEAARLMNLAPAACAYVGDTVSRDVIGARRARYGLAIQIKSFLTDKADMDIHVQMPDAIIHNLMQIVGLVAPEDESPARPVEGK
jgi:putative hydrolase of the HAD superfamily